MKKWIVFGLLAVLLIVFLPKLSPLSFIGIRGFTLTQNAQTVPLQSGMEVEVNKPLSIGLVYYWAESGDAELKLYDITPYDDVCLRVEGLCAGVRPEAKLVSGISLSGAESRTNSTATIGALTFVSEGDYVLVITRAQSDDSSKQKARGFSSAYYFTLKAVDKTPAPLTEYAIKPVTSIWDWFMNFFARITNWF